MSKSNIVTKYWLDITKYISISLCMIIISCIFHFTTRSYIKAFELITWFELCLLLIALQIYNLSGFIQLLFISADQNFMILKVTLRSIFMGILFASYSYLYSDDLFWMILVFWYGFSIWKVGECTMSIWRSK